MSRFIQTKILSDAVVAYLENVNTEFATVEDAAVALMKVVSDTNIAGTRQSNPASFFSKLTNTQGRAFAILPRSYAPQGYVDLCDDDKEGTLLHELGRVAVGGATHRSTVSQGARTGRTTTNSRCLGCCRGTIDEHPVVRWRPRAMEDV